MLRCLVAMLVLCCGELCARSENITLVLLWNNAGSAAIARNLFESKFRPAIQEACPEVAVARKANVNFVEIVQPRLMDIPTALDELERLGNCLFIGAHADVSTASLFAENNVPTGLTSGSAAAWRYPQMRLHELAPIPVPLVAEGVSRAISQMLGSGLAAGSTLYIILGSGYEGFHAELLAAKFPGFVMLYRLEPGLEFQLHDELRMQQARVFLLAATTVQAENFLFAAYKIRLLHPNYRWFLFNTALVQKNNFYGFEVVSKNITSMDFGPVATVISNGLNTTQSIYLFDILSVWSAYLKNILCNQSEVVNSTVDGLTGSFRLFPDGNVARLNWTMQFYKGLGEQRERIGNWSSTGAFHLEPPTLRTPTDEVLKRELNFNAFRVVTLLSPPFVQFKKGYENRTDLSLYDRLEGFAIDMCKKILANMSLKSVELFLQPDGSFGSYDPVEGWGGMVGTLMLNAADMACASMSDTDLRRGVIKFTQPLQSYQLSILYSKPYTNPVKQLFDFLSPFHLYTWLALLASGVAAGLVLAVLHRVSRNAQRLSLYEAMYVCLGTLVQGMKAATPDRPSAQLVIAIFWLSALLFLIIYVAHYAAKRTLERVQMEITDLESLPLQEAYEYGTLFGSVYMDFLKNSYDGKQLQVYRHISADPPCRQPRNISQALDMVSSGTFALIYNSAMNKYFSKTKCGFYQTGSFGQDSARLGLPGNAEYDAMINRIIDKLVTSGERDELFKRYFNPAKSDLPDCANKSLPNAIVDWIPVEAEVFNTVPGALTLNHTAGIAAINLAVCLFTLLLAIIELISVKLRQRCRQCLNRSRKNQSLRKAAALAAEEVMESQA